VAEKGEGRERRGDAARIEGTCHAFTHPSRGAGAWRGGCSGGVASLDPRLISEAPSGQALDGRGGRPRGRIVEDGHAAGGQTWRFVPTGGGPFALPPTPPAVTWVPLTGRRFAKGGGTRAAGPRVSHRSDSPTPARGGTWGRCGSGGTVCRAHSGAAQGGLCVQSPGSGMMCETARRQEHL